MSIHSKEISPAAQKLVVALVVIAAIFMLTIQPFITIDGLNDIQKYQYERIEIFQQTGDPRAPLIAETPKMVSFFYGMWTTLSFMAAILILFVLKPLYRGEKWAKVTALTCLSIPAVGSAYMLVPWLNFVSAKPDAGFPPALIIMVVTLAAYFAVLLAGKSSAKEKAILFVVFMAIGVVAGYSFGNGHAAHRILIGHPKMPVYADNGVWFLNYTRTAGWIVVATLIVSIPLLALRTKVGWWLCMVSAATTGVAGLITHYYRHDTVDYLLQGAAGLGLAVILLVPVIKKTLLGEE